MFDERALRRGTLLSLLAAIAERQAKYRGEFDHAADPPVAARLSCWRFGTIGTTLSDRRK